MRSILAPGDQYFGGPDEEEWIVCRNIKKLRQPERLPTEQELNDAALQFVRKVSGYRKPSRVNEKAFNNAVSEIAGVTRRLFEDFETR